MRPKDLIAALGFALICAFGGARAASLSPDESKLQADFKTAYQNPSVEQRKQAVLMLRNQTNPTFWQMLANLSTTDPDPGVRLEAFRVLARAPAHDNSVAAMLVASFNANKSSNRVLYGEKEIAYAAAMVHSEFKLDVVNALIEMGSIMAYPEFVLYDAKSGRPTQAAIDETRQMQTTFSHYLSILNKIAGTTFQPSHRAPTDIKNWWPKNMAVYVQADRDLSAKFKAEDAAKKK